jgi:hypothetical protein
MITSLGDSSHEDLPSCILIAQQGSPCTAPESERRTGIQSLSGTFGALNKMQVRYRIWAFLLHASEFSAAKRRIIWQEDLTERTLFEVDVSGMEIPYVQLCRIFARYTPGRMHTR